MRPLETTTDLVHSVEKVNPRRGRTHPATKVFQALRIAVNRELDVLQAALAAFSARLNPGGRFGVITVSFAGRPHCEEFLQSAERGMARPPRVARAAPQP